MSDSAKYLQAPLSLEVFNGVCDLSKRTYFHQIVNGNTAFQFVNAPPNVMAFELEVNHAAGAITWPGNVRWVEGKNPDSDGGLVLGKVHTFYFKRLQSTGGLQWQGGFARNS